MKNIIKVTTLALLLAIITTAQTATPEEVKQITEIVMYFKDTCSTSTNFPNINWLCEGRSESMEIGPYSRRVAVNALYILAILNMRYRNPETHAFKDIPVDMITTIYLQKLKTPGTYYEEVRGGFPTAKAHIKSLSRR